MARRKPLFDQKFGADFIKAVPQCPGVYEFLDAEGVTIYVGKAKILRRRLLQYRGARRRKVHRKMRRILDEAHSLCFKPCVSDLEALLLENEIIQQKRPRLNIAGAFCFLYPMLGIQRKASTLYLVYTTSPADFEGFVFYGAFRSRYITRHAYKGLFELLSYLGHREPKQALTAFPVIKYSRVAGFRQVNERWYKLLEDFFTGKSVEFLSEAVLELLEKPMARRFADEVQEHLNDLKTFFREEAKPLRKALADSGLKQECISQEERDALFIKSRGKVTTSKNAARSI